MQISPPTITLLTTLESHAGRPLRRRDDVAILLELAYRQDREPDLDRLSFLAKFLARTMGIMKRIGIDGQGYDRLSSEFTANLEQARALLIDFLRLAPDEARSRFQTAYLTMTPAAVENVLAFLQDLSSYKNWRIDHPGAPAWEKTSP
jgi:hypothetical protein